MAGYSTTPLAKKLGIGPGTSFWTVDAPVGFHELLAPLPAAAVELDDDDRGADVVVVFATTRTAVERGFHAAMSRIPPEGAIWVAWPKRSSGVHTDLSEDLMRELFLPTGMVDNKVAAIDDTWSGLRFVVRRENRPTWPQ